MKRDTAALALVLLLFVILCGVIGQFHPDRAFVAYRYADHVASGDGFVYNKGDAPSEAYGNTLWVVLCAAASRFGLPLPTMAPLISILFGVLALQILWPCIRGRAGPTATLALAGFAALSGPLAVAAASGEGVTLIVTLCLALVHIMSRPRLGPRDWFAAAITGILLSTCGFFYALLFPVMMAVRSRMPRGKVSLPGVLLFLVGVSTFHAWRVSVFGALLTANHVASLSDFFVVQPHDTAPFGYFYLLLGVAALAGAARARSHLDTLALVCAAIVGAITIAARDPLPGLATSAPFAILLMVPAAGLVLTVARGFRSRVIDVTLVGTVFLIACGWSMNLRTFAGYEAAAHDVTLAPLSRWLVEWHREATLLTDAPGAISYYSGWHTTLVGENTSGVDSEADVVILTSEGLFDPVMASPSARVVQGLVGRYRVLAYIRREWTRDRALAIYVRADFPNLTDEQQDSFPPGLGTVVRINR